MAVVAAPDSRGARLTRKDVSADMGSTASHSPTYLETNARPLWRLMTRCSSRREESKIQSPAKRTTYVYAGVL